MATPAIAATVPLLDWPLVGRKKEPKDIHGRSADNTLAAFLRDLPHGQATHLVRPENILVPDLAHVAAYATFWGQPNMLAGVKTGDRLAVSSARGAITAYALVTKRFKPMMIAGKQTHQIGLPWHWGYAGIATGDSANLLTPHVGDANTTIPEYKVFLCDLRKA